MFLAESIPAEVREKTPKRRLTLFRAKAIWEEREVEQKSSSWTEERRERWKQVKEMVETGFLGEDSKSE